MVGIASTMCRVGVCEKYRTLQGSIHFCTCLCVLCAVVFFAEFGVLSWGPIGPYGLCPLTSVCLRQGLWYGVLISGNTRSGSPWAIYRALEATGPCTW